MYSKKSDFTLKSRLSILLGLSVLTSAAWAPTVSAEELSSKSVEEYPASDIPSPKYAVFFGLDGGLAALDIHNGLNENDKKGVQLNLKALGSYYYRDSYVFDLGGGWFYDRLQGSNARKTEYNFLRSGFGEVSARYRINHDRWQVGPYFDLGFGADQSLGQGPQTDNTLGLYLGAQALYEIPSRNWPMRIGARFGTDLNIQDRNVFVGMLSFQVGIPFQSHSSDEEVYASKSSGNPAYSGSDASSLSPEAVAPTADTAEAMDAAQSGKPSKSASGSDRLKSSRSAETLVDKGSKSEELKTTEEEVEVEYFQDQVEVHLNKAITNFGTGSSKLSPKAKKFLIEMAHYLKKNAKLWKTVDVSGHTDIRGTLAFNMSLSRARARSVREALLLGGLSPKKVKVAGFGPKKPIDPRRNHKAYAKNRRVEIRFSGVKNASTLTRGITKIKKRIVSRTTIHASR